MSKLVTLPKPYLKELLNKSKSITITKTVSSQSTITQTHSFLKAKYLSRKKVKGKWVYTYPKQQKEKVLQGKDHQPTYKLNTTSVKSWERHLKVAPESIINELVSYYKTKKRNWNAGEIKITSKEKDEIVAFQTAIHNLGLTSKYFPESLKEPGVSVKLKYTKPTGWSQWEGVKNGIKYSISDSPDGFRITSEKSYDIGFVSINFAKTPEEALRQINPAQFRPKSEVTKAVIARKNGKLLLTKATTFSGHKLQDKYNYAGFPVSVENKKGSYRSWTDNDGNNGKTLMKYDYGYIRGTEGRDKDHVDVFVGPNEDCKKVFIVHQVEPHSGKYDEDKVMLGFLDAKLAKQAYLDHYDDPRFFGSMSTMSIEKFKGRVFRTKDSQRKSLKAALFNELRPDLLLKAKTYQVGEISEKTGKRKVAPGKWENVGDKKEPKKKPSKETGKKPEKKKDATKRTKLDLFKDSIKTTMKSLLETFSDYYSGESGAQEAAHGAREVGAKLDPEKKKRQELKKIEQRKKKAEKQSKKEGEK